MPPPTRWPDLEAVLVAHDVLRARDEYLARFEHWRPRALPPDGRQRDVEQDVQGELMPCQQLARAKIGRVSDDRRCSARAEDIGDDAGSAARAAGRHGQGMVPRAADTNPLDRKG